MGSLIFIVSFRRYQNGGHHGKGSECGRHHIAHHISVIVFAGPDIAAFGLHHPRPRIIDQRVEIGDPGLLKRFFVLRIVDFLENIFKRMVILFRNGILGCKPQILLCVQRIIETTSCKTFYGCIDIVHALNDPRAVKGMDQFSFFCSVCACIDQLHFSGSRNFHLSPFINVSVRMSCDRNRLFPVFHTGFNTFYHDRRTEHCAVQDGTDGAVGAFPHFFQIILAHTGGIGGNRSALHRHLIFFCGICGINGHLIIRLIAVFQSKIIILGIQLNKRFQQMFFDHLPEDPGHLVSVHLYDGRGHLNFSHLYLLLNIILLRLLLDGSSDLPAPS